MFLHTSTVLLAFFGLVAQAVLVPNGIVHVDDPSGFALGVLILLNPIITNLPGTTIYSFQIINGFGAPNFINVPSPAVPVRIRPLHRLRRRAAEFTDIQSGILYTITVPFTNPPLALTSGPNPIAAMINVSFQPLTNGGFGFQSWQLPLPPPA
ncbi:hypothetical protein B0H10DRAFT_2221547 [Mycena sp. CBHHK59/15]|nr:hypothetical protein B0H10DRAFT_2221547 [Mycena sp. CBHHK59/15]